MPLRGLCVGAELSEHISRALSEASTPWYSFLSKAALIPLLSGELIIRCKSFLLLLEKDFHASISISPKSELTEILLFLMGLVR